MASYDISAFCKLFSLISEASLECNSRKLICQAHQNFLINILDSQNSGFKKLAYKNNAHTNLPTISTANHSPSSEIFKEAFDTRRIDQETEFNPRRNLQHYNRSQEYLTNDMSFKLKNFAKVQKVLYNLKNKYGKEPEWQDSNARILLSTLEKGLRTLVNDNDFTNCQPALGSLSYLEELMQVRYRLSIDDLKSFSEEKLEGIIIAKDEELTRKDTYSSLQSNSSITKQDVATNNYDSLMDKLFGNVRASAENPSIERTITISIKDSVLKIDNKE